MTGAPRSWRNTCLLATLAVALTGFGPAAGNEEEPASSASAPLSFPESQLEPLQWTAVEGWQEDDHAAAFAAFQASCRPLIARLRRHQRKADTGSGEKLPMRLALGEICLRAAQAGPFDAAASRAFFEENFRPVRVGKLGEETGLLTGYYEPIIRGSRFPSDEYAHPVYAPPSDLVALGKRSSDGSFPNKGRVGRRVGLNQFVPYHDRGEIEGGAIAGQGYEICWVKDPIDAFFMQIQGSARVKLDTGKTMRLNYAAHNGHPYTPVGRILIERKEVTKEDMSMDRIRQWMERSADGGKGLRRENRSYVFMRETGLADDVEPTGAQGVSLTAGRSIAVDRKLHVYGTPFFINAALPIDSENPVTPFRRLMVAQDTGSAIVGLARADIYFGAGEEPGRIAGRIKQQGRFVMLVPAALDPAIGAHALPLPPRRPRQPDDPVLVASAPPSAALAYAAADRPAPPATAAVAALTSVRPGGIEPRLAVRAAVPVPTRRPPAREMREGLPQLKGFEVSEANLGTRLPAWLATVASISSAVPTLDAADRVRSFASAEAAIAAATAAPFAFAAPAVTQAAATMFGETTKDLLAPAPRAWPQGLASARR